MIHETYAWFIGLWCIASWLSIEFDTELFTKARAAESWAWGFMRRAQPGFWLIGFCVVGHLVSDPLERGWSPTLNFGIYVQVWFLSMIGWSIQRVIARKHGIRLRFPGDNGHSGPPNDSRPETQG